MTDWPTPPTTTDNQSTDTSADRIIPASQNNEAVFSASEPQLPSVRDDKGRFLTGNKGGGRKAGARNKFSEVLLKTLVEDFEQHGESALASLRATNPEAYVRVMISLLPKSSVQKYEQSFAGCENLTHDELVQLLEEVRHQRLVEKALETVSNG